MIYIWVPGPPSVQPSELLCWNNGPQYEQGRDYKFDTPQQAFDASDILRKRGQPYDLQITPPYRRPWLEKRMICCGF